MSSFDAHVENVILFLFINKWENLNIGQIFIQKNEATQHSHYW